MALDPENITPKYPWQNLIPLISCIIITNRHIRINPELKSEDIKEQTPGVGQYNINSTLPKGPSYTFRKIVGGVEQSKLFFSPGPGKYNTRSLIDSPSFSICGKHILLPDNVNNPGPGQYNIRNEKELKPIHSKYNTCGLITIDSFGNERRGDLSNLNGSSNSTQWKQDGPGPCDYSPNKIALHKSIEKCPFNKAKRDELFVPRNPGPADYNIPQNVGNEGLKHSFSKDSRNNSIEKFKGPGPGQYDVSLVGKPNCPGFKMNISPRLIKSNQENRNSNPTPGPCSYSTDKSTVLKKSFSNAPGWGVLPYNRKKLTENTTRVSPGPGKYNTSEDIGKGPKYTIGSKNPDNLKWINSIPGPGSYDTKLLADKFRKSPSWVIGNESRANTSLPIIPGPTDYMAQKYQIRPSVPFGKEKRLVTYQSCKHLAEAGPGLYKIPCSIIDVNEYTRSSGVFDNQFKYV